MYLAEYDTVAEEVDRSIYHCHRWGVGRLRYTKLENRMNSGCCDEEEDCLREERSRGR